MTKLLKLIFFIGLVAGISFGYGYYRLDSWSRNSIHLGEPKIITFAKGTSLQGLSSVLAREEVVDSAVFFRLWVRFFQPYQKFQAGTYKFEGEISPEDIAQTIMAGKIYEPIVLQYTIPEGFTLKQIAERLEAKGVGSKKAILDLTVRKSFLKAKKIKAPSLEGYIYPATYNFFEKPTAQMALERGIEVFWQNVPKNYESDVARLGLTFHQAVTFASLIELETVYDDEKPMVSEVIWNRLKDKIPLAIDAAIIYGIKDYAGDIRSKDLKDKSNPYNTRLHQGLPPTPIGSPSVSSLKAVLTPTQKGYYYYVLRSDGSQRHNFTKTLEEHQKFVRDLVRSLKKGPSRN